MPPVWTCRLCGAQWGKMKLTGDCLACMLQYGLTHTLEEVEQKTPYLFRIWEEAVAEAAETKNKLRDTESKLKAAQAKLEETEAELEATQAELAAANAKLKPRFLISDRD